jgi:3-hydroxybutyryl-CoA dehydrogenase
MELNIVAVIGNGIIGHGVAEVFATAGYRVSLIGRNDASLATAMERVRGSLSRFEKHGLLAAGSLDKVLSRISPTTDFAAAAEAELVIEAVPEDMSLKIGIFEHLERIAKPDAVLATSSGHLASEVSANLKTKHRVLATHFWYPPQLLPLVEVCAPEADPAVIDWTCARLRDVGKEPVVIDREIAGFIGNRIQFAILREAWSLWAAGVATAEAIDAVVKNSIGRRLAITGPIESADIGGLDTLYRFATFLQPTLDISVQPPLQVAERSRMAADACISSHSAKDRDSLRLAREEELFRWLKLDRKKS